MVPNKPTILVFADYYLPGYKAGGPIRSLENLVNNLSPYFQFKVVTRDRDLGDAGSFVTKSGDWVQVGNAEVCYISPESCSFKNFYRIISSEKDSILYLNSLFSPLFTLKPLLLRYLGLLPGKSVVLACRGELSDGALKIKSWKKKPFMSIAKASRFYHNVIWQASSRYEEEDIRRHFGERAFVMIAPNLSHSAAANNGGPNPRAKIPGRLRIVFLSRISRKKNLLGAIDILSGVSDKVIFDIYGPVEDKVYWNECRRSLEHLPENVAARYCGEVPGNRVIEIFSKYDLFLFPTWGENFGHVILEALVAGCPVLVSDQTPWRSLEDKGVGWDIPLGRTERFREIIGKCTSMDGVSYDALSRRAREYGVERCGDTMAVELNRKLFEAAALNPAGKHVKMPG